MKNGKIFRKIVQYLNFLGYSNSVIASDMGMDLRPFQMFFIGSREPSDDLLNEMMDRFDLMVEEDGTIMKKPVGKKEDSFVDVDIDETPKKVEEEPVEVKKELQEEDDIDSYFDKLILLNEENLKTVKNMIDSLLIIQRNDKFNKNEEVKHETLGLKLKDN